MALPTPHHQPTPWDSLPPERRQTAETILTPKQLEVLKHRINGHSWKTIADALTITEPSARDRYRAAINRLNRHYRKDAA